MTTKDITDTIDALGSFNSIVVNRYENNSHVPPCWTCSVQTGELNTRSSFPLEKDTGEGIAEVIAAHIVHREEGKTGVINLHKEKKGTPE